MKVLARIVTFIAMLTGLALLAWILYDASQVWRTLQAQPPVDEAALAVAGRGVASFLMGSALLGWRRLAGRGPRS
jgi:hypothetical protein